MFLYFALASLLGAVVGASEIVSRYRDAPYQALRTGSAWPPAANELGNVVAIHPTLQRESPPSEAAAVQSDSAPEPKEVDKVG